MVQSVQGLRKTGPGGQHADPPVWLAAFAALIGTHATAQTQDFAALEASQNAANAKAGPRTLPPRVIPVPQDVSQAAQGLVAAPYRVPAWDANPPSADEWRTLIKRLADASLPGIAKVRAELGVTMQPTTLGGGPRLRPDPAHDPGRPPQPGDLQHPRRRLCLRARRFGHGRGGAAGRPGRLQGVRGRLPHAARRALPGRHGRRDGRLQGRAGHDGPGAHRRRRHLHRRRHDVGADAACQGRGRAVARRDRTGHAVVRPDGDRGQLQDESSGWTTCSSATAAICHTPRRSTPTATTCTTRSFRRSMAISMACRRRSSRPARGTCSSATPCAPTASFARRGWRRTCRCSRAIRMRNICSTPRRPETKVMFGEVASFLDRHLAK